MLQIKNISKEYVTGELVQKALNDVSLNFRDNEFVAVLGPSGSGKTTLLNIVGGLDRYDSGDLIIDDVSTMNYTDRDWDSYRNHTVGFIFQSYNLIPHQSVLANVELALTISGISKEERYERAAKALEAVGLGDQLHKKPNQMSGGQMQRVAIARALVNNPDIVLADEPTGALDSATSVQVMDLLKEVAKNRLVIMVTHNPELAEQYATRIVKLKDGKIISDTDPVKADNNIKAVYQNFGKASMSFKTALGLSFNNLKTKLGRTLLTAFAGAIGIIGIALILSLSTGVNNYIDNLQEETLSSYPLTIEEESANVTELIVSVMGAVEDSESESKDNVITEVKMASNMFAQVNKNDLAAFKKVLDNSLKEIGPYVNNIYYNYGIVPNLYNADTSKKITQINPSDMLSSITNSINSSMVSTSFFNEIVDTPERIKEQYNIIAGKLPENYDEVLLVLTDDDKISDIMVYALGLRDQEEFKDNVANAISGKSVAEDTSPAMEFTYEDMLNLKFKLVLSSDYYKYNSKYNTWEDMTDDESYMKKLVDNGTDIKIVGIVSPKDSSVGSLTMGIAYTHDLIEYIVEESANKEIVKAQIKNSNVDVFSGKTFDEISDGNDSTGLEFSDLVTIDTSAIKSAFNMDIDEKDIQNKMTSYIQDMVNPITTDTSRAEKAFSNTYRKLFKGLINKNSNISVSNIAQITTDYINSKEAQEIIKPLASQYYVPVATFGQTYANLCASTLSSYAIANGVTNISIPVSMVDNIIDETLQTTVMQSVVKRMGSAMTEAYLKVTVSTKAGEMATDLMGSLAGGMNIDQDAFAKAFKFDMNEDELTRLIQALMTSSDDKYSYENNLMNLGYTDFETPIQIYIYAKDFESKDSVKAFIDEYNESMETQGKEDDVISYTDITGVLMSSVTSIVNTISYVLIAFVSISLVVSSIMIGIITYISVVERTKEIGILRSIGASKRDISNVFNAETFIIGLSSGIIGILVTIILNIPISIIVEHMTGISNVASLPVAGGIILIIISVILTLIAGIIPSRIAANKDPVIALRSE